jgi:hypothetical protein
MPPRPDDFQRRQADLLRQQREQAAGNILQGAQVGAGGILINNGGSLTIQGTGTFNTNGTITTSSAFSAGTTITAGGNITSTGGNISAAGTVSAGGALSGASLGVGSGSVTGGAFSGSSLSCSGNITSSGGAVYSSAAFQSPGSRNLVVTSGYVNAYLDVNGFLGYQPSTRRVKKDLGSIPGWLLDATLRLPTYMGRYKSEDATAPRTPFLIAEDVRAAGFGPSVVPLDVEGQPAAINTQNLVPVLLELIKRQQKQIDDLKAEVASIRRK